MYPRNKRFHLATGTEDLGTQCQACGERLRTHQRLQGEFIKPEFGFVAADQPRASGKARPRRGFASRVYFAEYAPNASGAATETEPALVPEISGASVMVEQRHSRFGRLVLVNAGPRGRGFQVCQTCGYAQLAPEPRPQRLREAGDAGEWGEWAGWHQT